jgi:predicted nucleic acid-binding protein
MKLVVDTNILFSFFKQLSITRDIILSGVFDMISPDHSKTELRKYSAELLSKSKISSTQFESVLIELDSYLDFIKLDNYSEKISEAYELGNSVPKQEYEEFIDDIDFFALALNEDCPIWSNDKLFKKQSRIEVFNTFELMDILQSRIEDNDSSSI